MTETTIKCHEVKRFENLMYKGCEPHWHCIHCDNYWPFHCYGRKDLEQMECPARNDRLVMFDDGEKGGINNARIDKTRI